MTGSMPTMAVALRLAGAGALVEVSTYLEAEEEFTYQWGKESEFDDTDPGQFAFTLRNTDGRFTPLNPNSPYATPLAKGTEVCWQTNTRLVHGTVQGVEPTFPGDDAAWAEVTVTCDDMLGTASRFNPGLLAGAIVKASSPWLYYPLNDDEGSITAADASGNNAPPLQLTATGGASFDFGAEAAPPVGESQLQLTTADAIGDNAIAQVTFPAPLAIAYPAGSRGFFNTWVTPDASNGWQLAGIWSPIGELIVGASALNLLVNGAPIINVHYPAVTAQGAPAYVEASLTFVLAAGVYTYTVTLYINSVVVGTFTGTSATLIPQNLTAMYILQGGIGTSLFSHLSHTPNLVHEEWADVTTFANRIAALQLITAGITFAAVPADISSALIGVQDTSSGSVLDAINLLNRSEEGELYCTTTGTLTAPVETINFRARNRPDAPALVSFDLEDDLAETPDVAYDLTDTISSVDVTGAGGIELTVSDPTLISQVGDANDSFDVAYANSSDIYTAGSDRIARGGNPSLKFTSVTVDLVDTETDRWADYLAINPGDRVELTNQPVARLGITSWDGWLIGASETHTTSSSEVVPFLQPCLPHEGVYDTDVFAADGDLTLTAGITAAAVSATVTSSDGTLLDAADTPFDVVIDRERITISALAGAGPQTATIVRGVGGTTAAAHALGATIEAALAAAYAF